MSAYQFPRRLNGNWEAIRLLPFFSRTGRPEEGRRGKPLPRRLPHRVGLFAQWLLRLRHSAAIPAHPQDRRRSDSVITAPAAVTFVDIRQVAENLPEARSRRRATAI